MFVFLCLDRESCCSSLLPLSVFSMPGEATGREHLSSAAQFFRAGRPQLGDFVFLVISLAFDG